MGGAFTDRPSCFRRSKAPPPATGAAPGFAFKGGGLGRASFAGGGWSPERFPAVGAATVMPIRLNRSRFGFPDETGCFGSPGLEMETPLGRLGTLPFGTELDEEDEELRCIDTPGGSLAATGLLFPLPTAARLIWIPGGRFRLARDGGTPAPGGGFPPLPSRRTFRPLGKLPIAAGSGCLGGPASDPTW